MASPSPSAPPDKAGGGKSFRIPTSLEEVLIQSLLKGSGPPPSVKEGKESLNAQTMAVNFKRFVQKSGPIFVAQDAVEAVLLWEDTFNTAFFAALYGFLCYRPLLVLFIPNVVLVSILLSTYEGKKQSGPPPESQEGPTPLAEKPPAEGTISYFGNLQNIQIMMGRVSDLMDSLRSLVPYLTWQQPAHSYSHSFSHTPTHALLIFAVLSSFGLALIAPYLPYRLLFFLLGEAVFLAGHPLSRSFLSSSASSPEWEATKLAQQKRLAQLGRRLLEDDALGDDETREGTEVVEVQRLEVETKAPASEGGWVNEATVGGECPEGFKWLGEWEDGAAEGGGVDPEGWTYIHLDGSRTASPTMAGEKGPVLAQSRRRRLTRRAIRVGAPP